MPRPEINDYVFYKIVCDELPEYVYIGSTACFSKRKKAHKCSCNKLNSKKHNFKLYQTIRDNGGWDKWNMVVIDKLNSTTLLDARIKEESLRKEYNGNLNMVKAHVTVEEKKEHYELNKEVILKKHKEYRENNKELIAEKKKEHYELNKEVILKNAKEKITCDCGSIFTKRALNRHINSLKHQQFCQPIDLSI